MGLEIQVRITRAANPSDILWENLTVRGVWVFGTGCFILEGEKLQNKMIKGGCLTNTFSRWWQLKYFLFTPQKLGRRIHFDQYLPIGLKSPMSFVFFFRIFFGLTTLPKVSDHFIPKTSQKYGSSRAPPQIWQPPLCFRTDHQASHQERLWLRGKTYAFVTVKLGDVLLQRVGPKTHMDVSRYTYVHGIINSHNIYLCWINMLYIRIIFFHTRKWLIIYSRLTTFIVVWFFNGFSLETFKKVQYTSWLRLRGAACWSRHLELPQFRWEKVDVWCHLAPKWPYINLGFEF